MDSYKESLVNQYKWYLNKIEEYHNEHRWDNIPSDSFYFKLTTGSIKEKKEDIEWLEYAISKLQTTLGNIEMFFEKNAVRSNPVNRLKKV